MKQALLIVAHGSKKTEPKQTFFKLVQYVKQQKQFDEVIGAFMQFSSPTIEESIAGLYEYGIRSIVVMPYFLFKGIHITRDIQNSIDTAKEQYSGLNIVLAEPLGYAKRLGDLIIERAKSAE